MKNSVCALILGLASVGLTTSGMAQTVAGFGAISGTVRDASGAAVPGAEVLVTNPSKGIRRSMTTTEAGVFSATALVPASGYSLTVNKQGFQAFEVKDIEILVGQNVSIPVVLTVAGTATQVNVEASAPLVESTKTDVSQVVESDQILNLPINGRRVDSFVLLAPGVVPDGNYGLLSFRGIAGGNAFLTDGNDTTEQFFNENAGRTRITAQISQDAVQEFQVLTNNFSAEFGRASGGVVNTVTRSGTNDLHGTTYWFFRNQDFNARDPFSMINPEESRHQAGGSLGGRIIKDKLFYFGNVEVTRRNFPLVAQILNGPLFDSTGKYIGVCGAPATPAQCEAARKFLDRQFQVVDRRADTDMGFLKLDYRPIEKHSFTASMNYMKWLSPNGIQTAAVLSNGAGVGNNANSSVRVANARMSWTAIPTASSLNEFRFGWFKDKQYDYPNPKLEIPGIGLLGISITGQSNLGTATNYPRVNPSENRFQFADTASLTRGRHSMKFGIDFAHTEDYVDQMTNRWGTYSYSSFTNLALDLTGNTTGAKNWNTYTQGMGNPVVDFTIKSLSVFGQDQFRITPKWTLNYGVRYDREFLPQPPIMNPDYPATGRIPQTTKNFAPRIGVAYAFNDNKTVVRAGYGIFFARYPGGTISTFFLQNGLYQKSISLQGSNAADRAIGPVFPNRLTSLDRPVGAVDLTFAAPDFRNVYTQQGQFGVEHQFTRTLALTVTYMWSRGLHIPTVRDLNIGPLGPPVTFRINDLNGNMVGAYTTPTYLRANRVDPRYSRLNQVDNGGNSYYNGLAVQMRKRLSKGLQGSLSYTWSHAIDYGQSTGNNNIFFSNGPQTVFNGDYRGEKGNAALDQRHRLTVSAVYSPRFTKSDSMTARYLVNNWQLSVLGTFASSHNRYASISVGTPFPGAAFSGSLNGFGGSSRVPFWPNQNVLVDPIKKIDARLSKKLPIKDKYTVFLSFEAFNVFNDTYYTNVQARAFTVTTVNAAPYAGILAPDPTFRRGTETYGSPDGTNARRVQLALRLVF